MKPEVHPDRLARQGRRMLALLDEIHSQKDRLMRMRRALVIIEEGVEGFAQHPEVLDWVRKCAQAARSS